MPVTRITTNFEMENAAEFIHDFHDTMKAVLKIPEYDRLVILDEKPDGFFQPTNTSGKYILFEISLFTGRTMETKRKLYKQLVHLALRYHIEATHVRIVLNEIAMENWGIRGGQAASDVALGFETHI